VYRFLLSFAFVTARSAPSCFDSRFLAFSFSFWLYPRDTTSSTKKTKKRGGKKHGQVCLVACRCLPLACSHILSENEAIDFFLLNECNDPLFLETISILSILTFQGVDCSEGYRKDKQSLRHMRQKQQCQPAPSSVSSSLLFVAGGPSPIMVKLSQPSRKDACDAFSAFGSTSTGTERFRPRIC